MSSFRPPLALTLLTAVVVFATLNLAAWQWNRAAEKSALETTARAAMRAAAVNVADDAAAPRPFLRAVAGGRYLPQWEILIDNRIQRRRVGYYVITPLLLENGRAIAVNRGWIAATANRAILPKPPPPPTTKTAVVGFLTVDDSAAVQLSPQTASGRVWQNLRLSEYADYSGLSLLTLVLVKQATVLSTNSAADSVGDSANNFLADSALDSAKNSLADSAADLSSSLSPVSVRVNFKAARSLSYAGQWLSFCLLAIIFYVVLGFKLGRKKR